LVGLIGNHTGLALEFRVLGDRLALLLVFPSQNRLGDPGLRVSRYFLELFFGLLVHISVAQTPQAIFQYFWQRSKVLARRINAASVVEAMTFFERGYLKKEYH
jgi:hypothetical protein